MDKTAPSRKTVCRSLLAAAAFTGCSALVPTPAAPPVPSDVRPVTSASLEDLIAHRRARSVTMRIFNTGDVRTRGRAVSSKKGWSDRVALDAPAFLIRHSSEGYVLFDAGLSGATVKEMSTGFLAGLFTTFESAPGQDLASQLRAGGVEPGDVRWVILSHLHLDHAARAGDFPNATVVVSRREWEAQKARQALHRDPNIVDPAAREGRWTLRLVDFAGAPAVGPFDRAVDLFSDGSIYLVDLPGHTPGSMGAWVNLDGGPALLAGDAAWVADNYAELALPIARAMTDLKAYWRNLVLLKSLKDSLPGLVIFPGHDLSPLRASGRADVSLAPFAPDPAAHARPEARPGPSGSALDPERGRRAP